MNGVSLDEVIRQLDGDNPFKIDLKKAKISTRVESLYAYFACKNDGFGGKERSIHFAQLTFWKGARWGDTLGTLDPSSFVPYISEVSSKRTVVTGTYFKPTSWYDSYTGEYDYTPGGLENQKVHVIIRTIDGYEFHTDDIEPVKEIDEQAK